MRRVDRNGYCDEVSVVMITTLHLDMESDSKATMTVYSPLYTSSYLLTSVLVKDMAALGDIFSPRL